MALYRDRSDTKGQTGSEIDGSCQYICHLKAETHCAMEIMVEMKLYFSS